MVSSPRLSLPYLSASQSQKHVTVNESLRKLDALVQLSVVSRTVAAQPGAPADGDVYILPAGKTGAAWGSMTDLALGYWVDGAWSQLTPKEGWSAFVQDENVLIAYDGAAWASPSLDNASKIGVNATADATNKLAVKSNAVLFDALDAAEGGTGDSQVKVNKEAAADTASHLFLTGFSGRAEFGLTGDDDFHIKVSPDGAVWNEAMVVARATGAVTFPNSSFGAGGANLSFTRDADSVLVISDSGTDADLPAATAALAGVLSAADKAKLDGVEAGATADQTAGEIETAYNAQVAKISAPEIAAGTEIAVRRYSPADVKSMIDTHAGTGGADAAAIHDNVAGEISLIAEKVAPVSADFLVIEDSAAANAKKRVQIGNLPSVETAASIKTKYESNADTNAFTDAEQTKLAGVAAGATVNATDAALRDRATHTGAQAVSTVTGLQTALDAKAPLASPALTGAPTAPTQAQGDNSTKLATTAYVDALRPTEALGIAASDETTALTAGTAKATFRMPYAFTLSAVRATLTTAQTSGLIFTVDLNEAGISVLSTKLTVDNTEKTSVTALTAAVISDTALADDAEITIDIDQIGDGTAKGLKIWLIGTRP